VKYGIEVDQLSAHGQAAVRAAERHEARTIIYRDQVPLAAIVPASDLNKLDTPDPGESGSDPLLALAGTCHHDVFVDQFHSDLGSTMLFRRSK
jgi:hypothetical protein